MAERTVRHDVIGSVRNIVTLALLITGLQWRRVYDRIGLWNVRSQVAIRGMMEGQLTSLRLLVRDSLVVKFVVPSLVYSFLPTMYCEMLK